MRRIAVSAAVGAALVAVLAATTSAWPLATGTAACDAHLFWVQVEPRTRSVLVFKPLTLPLDGNGHVTMEGAVLRLLALISPSSGSLVLGADCRRAAAQAGRHETSLLTSPFSLRTKNVLFCHGPPELRITITVRREGGVTRLLVDRGKRRLLHASSGARRGALSFHVVDCSREQAQRGA